MPWVPRLFFLLVYRVFFFRNYFKRTNSVFTLRAFLFALPSLHPFILWIAQRRNQKLETRINSVTFSRLTLIGCCRFSTCPSRVTGARERNFKKKRTQKMGPFSLSQRAPEVTPILLNLRYNCLFLCRIRFFFLLNSFLFVRIRVVFFSWLRFDRLLW